VRERQVGRSVAIVFHDGSQAAELWSV
jgi:hypothetical protein